jgi:taurine dioxygenase
VRALAAGDLDIANLGSSVVAVAAGRQIPIETFLIASQLGTSEALLSLVGTHVLTLIERILGMAIEVTRLSRALGAIVHGVDISQDLPQYVIDRLGEVLVEHQVLFFRDQPITPEAQCRFAAKFGSLHIHPIYPVLPELPEIMLIDTHEGFLPDNDNWHTDVTFSETPPLAGILAAKRLPPLGGDTLWSSSAAAYDALSEPVRRFLQGLTAQHSVAKSFPPERWQNDPEFQARYERAVAKHPPVNHPVVRTHPVSGRKGLFVNEGFTTHINELKPRESQTLLSFLFAHVAQPEFTVRWRWSVDDIAFWDNRITQHYAIADYLPERRTMHRATVIGDKPV